MTLGRVALDRVALTQRRTTLTCTKVLPVPLVTFPLIKLTVLVSVAPFSVNGFKLIPIAVLITRFIFVIVDKRGFRDTFTKIVGAIGVHERVRHSRSQCAYGYRHGTRNEIRETFQGTNARNIGGRSAPSASISQRNDIVDKMLDNKIK